jgi:hypothetical protein
VLYVDHNASPQEMFAQISGHMDWILKNPEEAIELARRSHRIFVEKFPMEKEVSNMEKFFREIIAENGTA